MRYCWRRRRAAWLPARILLQVREHGQEIKHRTRTGAPVPRSPGAAAGQAEPNTETPNQVPSRVAVWWGPALPGSAARRRVLHGSAVHRAPLLARLSSFVYVGVWLLVSSGYLQPRRRPVGVCVLRLKLLSSPRVFSAHRWHVYHSPSFTANPATCAHAGLITTRDPVSQPDSGISVAAHPKWPWYQARNSKACWPASPISKEQIFPAPDGAPWTLGPPATLPGRVGRRQGSGRCDRRDRRADSTRNTAPAGLRWVQRWNLARQSAVLLPCGSPRERALFAVRPTRGSAISTAPIFVAGCWSGPALSAELNASSPDLGRHCRDISQPECPSPHAANGTKPQHLSCPAT